MHNIQKNQTNAVVNGEKGGGGWTEVAGEVSETFLCKYIADNWGSHAHTLLTLKQLALRAMCCLGFIARGGGLEAAAGPKLGAENWG